MGYNPAAKFAFPLSYAAGILVSDQSPNIVRVGNVITTTIDATIGYGITYVVDSRVLSWNSNRYTLDFPVVDCWWFAFFDGIHHPQGYQVYWTYYGTPALPYIEIRNPFSITDHVVVLRYTPDVDYWLAPYPA